MAKKHKKRVLVQEEVDDEEPVSDDKRLEHDKELDGAGGRATVGKKRQGTGREKGKAGRVKLKINSATPDCFKSDMYG